MLATDPRTADFSFVEMLLEEQQSTAVEKFAQLHEDARSPLHASTYRDLLPATAPQMGQQYAFEVDLDLCSGCKACVSACHSLNGLEENELWRSVGMLHGGSADHPVLQHVTTACHHCIEPACLHGCPVKAYEKNPITGIVKHLDDQCIGCQYCMLKCPYDVPQYSKSKGIVRKCDMCSDRLASGEAPACVQSCPNKAIRITLVDQQDAVEASESSVVPAAPASGYTIPTTHYKSKRILPRNLLPADYYSARPAHCHTPLIVMLVLTQMSVGAFVVEQLMSWGAAGEYARAVHLIAALLLGLLGLFASVFHLGRPRLAYLALIGLRTSWLSREILAFSLFALMASAYVLMACAPQMEWQEPAAWNALGRSEAWLGAAAGVTGLLAVGCSMMIYIDTRRPYWGPAFTVTRFLSCSFLLGIPVALLIALTASLASSDLVSQRMLGPSVRQLCQALILLACFKLVFEASIFGHLRSKTNTPLKRTAQLLSGELSRTVALRFLAGVIGGVLLPLILLGESQLSPSAGFHPIFVGVVSLLLFALCIAGEFLERYLYFTAVVAPKMPGVQAS